MGGSEDGLRAAFSCVEGEQVPTPGASLSQPIYSAPRGRKTSMTWGRILLVRCPELCPSLHLPHPDPPAPGFLQGPGVHRCSASPLLPLHLSSKLEALLINRLVREGRSSASQPLLHTVHIQGCARPRPAEQHPKGQGEPSPNSQTPPSSLTTEVFTHPFQLS